MGTYNIQRISTKTPGDQKLKKKFQKQTENFEQCLRRNKVLIREKQELLIETITLRKRVKVLDTIIEEHEPQLAEAVKESETTLIMYQKDVLNKFWASLMVAKPTEFTKTQVNIYCDFLGSFLRMEAEEKLEFKKMLQTGKHKDNLKKSIIVQK